MAPKKKKKVVKKVVKKAIKKVAKKSTVTTASSVKMEPNVSFPFANEDMRKDIQCTALEMNNELETLRFIKSVKLGAKDGFTTDATEALINKYREEDALAYARTIKKILTEENQDFRDMLLDNAEARLREYKNRPK